MTTTEHRTARAGIATAGYAAALIGFGALVGWAASGMIDAYTAESQRIESTVLSDDYEVAMVEYLNVRDDAIRAYADGANAGVDVSYLGQALEDRDRLATTSEVRRTTVELQRQTDIVTDAMGRQ